MEHLNRAPLCLLLLASHVIAAVSTAPSSAPSLSKMDEVRFFGRWDLSAPDRALTVNTGSYILAQFSGTSIAAAFNVTSNKAPFPTIAWRIDGNDWQESEISPRCALAERSLRARTSCG